MPDRPTGSTGYIRTLGLFPATMIVMGGIIGAGIFLNPAIVAERSGTTVATLLAWLGGGLIAVLGGLVFAELGARRPLAGGSYVYIREAFGALPAFLYAWTLLLVIATGGVAAVAITFASYATALVGAGPGAIVPLAVGAIVFLSAVNYLGVVRGAATASALTLLKLAALAALIVAGLWGAGAGRAEPMADAAGGAGFAAALVPVLFAYGGWQQLNWVGSEVTDGERTIPRAILLGVAGVVLVYLLANLAYLLVLGPAGLAASTAPAADVMRRVSGPVGATLVSAGVAASTFGFLSVVILAAPRVYQAMAADLPLLAPLARLHPRHRTPAAAIVLQATWAVILALSGTYGELLDWVVFGDWIFFGLAGLALFHYRRHDSPGSHGGFRTPGYPLVPLLFVGASAFAVWGSVSSNPGNALRGTLLLLVGIPVWWLGHRHR